MRKISLSNLNNLFAKIAEKYKLYIPVDGNNGLASFKLWQEGTEMSNALNTTRSAKDFFFPQTENLMEFKTSGKNIEIKDVRSEKDDFVVFGVRGCDAKSFEILDKVFLSDPVDSYYAARREKGIIVSLACGKPAETCFCTAFGIDPATPSGDITAWKTQTDLYLKANTEKGEKLLGIIDSLTCESDEKAVEEQKKNIAAVLEKLPLKGLKTDKFGVGKTKEYFDSPAWDELSSHCLGCGTCTFVCPTCQCYDIKDFNTGNGVKRFRCWDSCMYSDFTLMAHGNSRLSQKERFRQRFMHKLVYFPDNNDGTFGCVGCGRCLAKCPISMNIVKVMKTLGGEDNE